MAIAVTPQRTELHQKTRQLNQAEREKLIESNLRKAAPRNLANGSPSIPVQNGNVTSRKSGLAIRRPRGFRQFLLNLIHRLLFFLIHLIFSVYIRIRQTYHAVTDRIFAILYYHHRTPELIQRDIKDLPRLPSHLSVIVELSSDGSKTGETEALSQLIGDVAEISAWCTCAGIPMLSVYERTGILKMHIPSLHSALSGTFHSYFPPTALPNLHIRAPDHPTYSPPSSRSASQSPPHTPLEEDGAAPRQGRERPTLNMLLLSAADGRATLVDLTKTLADMAQRGKLTPGDVSTELVDAEVTESSCGEPDLLIIMAPSVYRGRGAGRRIKRRRKSRSSSVGPREASGTVEDNVRSSMAGDGKQIGDFGPGGDMCLRGYPPWQVRLTEIFNVQDNSGVDYQVFLRGLYRYAKAEMRFGR